MVNATRRSAFFGDEMRRSEESSMRRASGCRRHCVTALLLFPLSVPSLAQPSFRRLGTANCPVPHAVSADGTTVVGRACLRAFRWTEATGVVLLDPLPPPYDDGGTGHDVSADGSVVVGTAVDLDGLTFPTWGFRWTETEGTVPVGPSPAGQTLSTGAYGISADGSVIVGRTHD